MPWLIAAAAQAGLLHQKQADLCQDHIYHRQNGNTMTAALADGAGSAPRGSEGACVAAQTAARFLYAQAPTTPDETREVLVKAAEAARGAIEKKARCSGAELHEYHTTLLAVIHTGGLLGSLQIGDGVTIAASPEGEARLIHQPQQGRYANETSFLTDQDFRQRLMISAEEAGRNDRIFLTSDGMQRLVLEYQPGTTPAPYREFFQKLFGWLEKQQDPGQARESIIRLLKSPRVTSRTRDDTSIIAAMLKTG